MKKVFGIALLAVALIAVAFWYFTPTYNEDVYYYDDFVQTAEDCTQYEKFDTEEEYCYYECETEEECREIEALIDAELEEWAQGYEDFASNFSEFEGDSGDVDTEVEYNILPGEQFVVAEGAETQEHIRIRNWLAAISPDAFSDEYIGKLGIFNAPNSGDGAFVEPSFDEFGKWDMYVNRDVLSESEQEMVFTLIHEFAHILTLNSSQIDDTISESSCQTHYIEEGCTLKNSYFYQFFTTFWSNGSGGYSPEYFVTEYAASNPGEDIAESFATFILNVKPNGASVAEQKTSFFYDYPELIQMRGDMRRVLTSFVRARQR